MANNAAKEGSWRLSEWHAGLIWIARSLLIVPVFACSATPPPARMDYADGLSPVASVLLNGSATYKFVVDTGASNSSIRPRDAKLMALADVGDDVGVGSTGNTAVRLVRAESMALAGLTRRSMTLAALDGPTFDDPAVTGLLGTDMFEGAIVRFDFRRGQLAILKRPPGGTRWIATDARWLRPWKIMLPVRINGVSAMAFLDSGAQHSVVNPALADAAGLKKGDAAREISGMSGDMIALSSSRAQSIAIGPWLWADADIDVAHLPVFERLLGSDVPQLMLGADLLRGREFVIDYAKERIWLAR
jgi:predicted aspartyl protease